MKNVLAGLFGLALAVTLMPSAAWAVEDAPPSARAAPDSDLVVAEGADVLAEGEGSVSGEVLEAQSAAQVVDEGGTATAVAEDGASVEVGKVIEPTGLENYFDITLTVDVSEEPGDDSTAVVLVMDVSNTMNDIVTEGAAAGSTRLESAQAAASAFVQQYCEGEGLSENRMLGVVTFNTNAQWANGLQLQQVSASSTAGLQSSILAITAPGTPSEVRFTNVEAGLRLAYNVLSDLQVAHKYLILLTDGFPTTYIDRSVEGNYASDVSIAGYNPYQQGAYDPTKLGEDGYFADAVLGLPCTYGTSYSDKAAQRAVEAAAALKDGDPSAGLPGVNIFSIGIDIGGQTIDYYVSSATGTFSIVDRLSDSYVIGDANDTSSYQDWLGTAIAGGPNLTEESHRYANGDSAEELHDAFADILADIRQTSSMPLREAVVTDPMGADIEFVCFFDENGDPADELVGSYGETTAENPLGNTAAFDVDAASIVWDLMQSGYAEMVGDDGVRTYQYQLKYRVRLMNEMPLFAFGVASPANDDAELTYKTLGLDGELVENDPVVFPNPSVKGYEGALDLMKVDANSGKPVHGALFELAHADDCAVCAAMARVAIEPQQQVSDESGDVRFAGIPSGHDYVLVEAQPAEGYLPSDARFEVLVSYGQVSVRNAEGEDVALSGAGADGAAVLRVENEPIEVLPPAPDPDVPAPVGGKSASMLPQTGDDAFSAFMMLLGMAVAALVAAASGMAVTGRGEKKRA